MWSTEARLVLAGTKAVEPSALDRATAIADRLLAEVDAACSRFRTDSEVARAAPHLPTGITVSPLLAMLVRHALEAAEATGGAVDPTLGYAIDAAGYDRDIRLMENWDHILPPIVSPRPGWQCVSLDGDRLQVPAHLRLDFGATAKAIASDLVASRIAGDLACGVLISLGGDIATAGAAPKDGWNVLVQDLPADPAARIRLNSGRALATSSTQKRRWNSGGLLQHHILDPQTGKPANAVWRSVSVAAGTCLRANTFSTAGIVRGTAAVDWFDSLGVCARLVSSDGTVTFTGDWPPDAEIENQKRGRQPDG